MKKFLFLTGVAALALTSCSQEDVLGVNDGKSPDNIVTFRAHLPKASRSQEFTTDNLQEFMVFGFKGFTDDDELAEGNLENFFNEEGTPVKFSLAEDGFFRSETTYYYPTNGTGLYFACFAPESLLDNPADASQVGIQADKFGGLKMDKFTVNPDITKQVDIIVENAPGHLDVTEGDMSLIFQHALSKIYISEVRNTGNPYRYEIKGVKFGNIHTAGTFEYRGERCLAKTADDPNGCFDEDGFLCDDTGFGIFWKAGGQQKDEITYLFDEPIILDKEHTVSPVMSGGLIEIPGEDDDETPVYKDDTKGSFMMIPQKLSSKFIDENDKEYGTIEGLEFDPEMSYIAFLVRIINTDKYDMVVYPYNVEMDNGDIVYKDELKNISQVIDGNTYAWAAFPVSSLWLPRMYVDYCVDFSKGAGYVAPGADKSLECKPILTNEIKFTEEVGIWNEGSWTTVDHESELGVDVTDVPDPFGARRK